MPLRGGEQRNVTICIGPVFRTDCSAARVEAGRPTKRLLLLSKPEKMVACNREVNGGSGENDLGAGVILTIRTSGVSYRLGMDVIERRDTKICLNFGLSKRDEEATIREDCIGRSWEHLELSRSFLYPFISSFFCSLFYSFCPPLYCLPSTHICKCQTLYREIQQTRHPHQETDCEDR